MKNALSTIALLLFFALMLPQAAAMGIDVALAQQNYKVGDAIMVSGAVTGAPEEYDVSIRFVGEKTLTPPIIVKTDAAGRFDYALDTLPGDAGEYRLIVESMGKNKEIVSASRAITLSETGKSGYFNVEFLLPANMEQFFYNDNIMIKIRVLEGTNPVEDAVVKCRFVFPKLVGDSVFSEDKTIVLAKVGAFFSERYKVDLLDLATGGIYLESYKIQKTDPTPFWVVKCYADREGYAGGASRIIKVGASPITLEVVSPKGTVGDSVDIIIQAKYPNKEPAAGLLVLMQDSENKTTALEETSNGMYALRGYRITTRENYWSFVAVATDLGQNVGKTSAVFAVYRTDWIAIIWKIWWLAPLLIGLAMLLKYLQEEIDSMHRQSKPEKIKELLKELEKLKRERKQVQVSKEIVEKKYYQRLIDSEAFKRMMEDYEKRAINLGVEINDCEDDLAQLKKP
ncbi:MAG: hypothetical protein V1731_00965 [Candidatus Aenigmatarchaeota archaeon]